MGRRSGGWPCQASPASAASRSRNNTCPLRPCACQLVSESRSAWSPPATELEHRSGGAGGEPERSAPRLELLTRSYTNPVAEAGRSALRAVGPWRWGGSSWTSPSSEHANRLGLTSGSLDPAAKADLAILSGVVIESPLMRRLRTVGIALVQSKAEREPPLAGRP